MRLARKYINFDRGFSHIVFRTNSGEYFFESERIKKAMMSAAKKYKDQYGIKIIDYCFMDNHSHYTMYYPTVDALSRFMHDMNLAIAKAVNYLYKRRGKAISDRFLSPVICDMKYCRKVIEYIWMNPVEAEMIDIKNAHNYKYCSLYYRFRGLKDPLADSYEELEALTGFKVLADGQSEQRFAIDLVNALKSQAIEKLRRLKKLFDHLHSIGPDDFIKARLHAIAKSKNHRPPDDPNTS